MKTIDLIITGAGNPDIVKLVDDINQREKTYNLIGFLEKNKDLFGSKFAGYEIIGGDDLLKTEFNKCAVVNNVWDSYKTRSGLSKKIAGFGITNFPNMIHPSINKKHLTYGKGNIVYENVSLGSNVIIGDFNIIFYGSVIGHQAVLGNYNLLGGNVMIGSRANISNGVIVGNSGTINNNISICDDVFVGIGSVVIGSIRKPKRVFGNPAREIINNHILIKENNE